MEKKRLEYLDAMRGFTMILVVYSHIILYAYQIESAICSYNDMFVKFRMPLFFFVSGFILFKPSRVWDWATTSSFIRKKFMVQIIPTICFLLLYISVFGYDIVSALADKFKAGYWFTIALFEYFLIYSLTFYIGYRLKTFNKSGG